MPKRMAAKGAAPKGKLLFAISIDGVTAEWDVKSSHLEAQYARALGEQLVLWNVLQKLSLRSHTDPVGVLSGRPRTKADAQELLFRVVTAGSRAGGGDARGRSRGSGGATPVAASSVYSWRGLYNTSRPDEVLTLLLINQIMCHGVSFRHAEQVILQLMDVYIGFNYPSLSLPNYSRKFKDITPVYNPEAYLAAAVGMFHFLETCPHGTTRLGNTPKTSKIRRPFFVPPPTYTTLFTPPPWPGNVPRRLQNAAGYNDFNGDGYNDFDEFDCDDDDMYCEEAEGDWEDYNTSVFREGEAGFTDEEGFCTCSICASNREVAISAMRHTHADPNLGVYGGNMLWLLVSRHMWRNGSLPGPVALAAAPEEVEAAIVGTKGGVYIDATTPVDSAVETLLDEFLPTEYHRRMGRIITSGKFSKTSKGTVASPLMNWQGQFIHWHGGYSMRARLEAAEANLATMRSAEVGCWAVLLLWFTSRELSGLLFSLAAWAMQTCLVLGEILGIVPKLQTDADDATAAAGSDAAAADAANAAKSGSRAATTRSPITPKGKRKPPLATQSAPTGDASGAASGSADTAPQADGDEAAGSSIGEGPDEAVLATAYVVCDADGAPGLRRRTVTGGGGSKPRDGLEGPSGDTAAAEGVAEPGVLETLDAASAPDQVTAQKAMTIGDSSASPADEQQQGESGAGEASSVSSAPATEAAAAAAATATATATAAATAAAQPQAPVAQPPAGKAPPATGAPEEGAVPETAVQAIGSAMRGIGGGRGEGGGSGARGGRGGRVGGGARADGARGGEHGAGSEQPAAAAAATATNAINSVTVITTAGGRGDGGRGEAMRGGRGAGKGRGGRGRLGVAGTGSSALPAEIPPPPPPPPPPPQQQQQQQAEAVANNGGAPAGELSTRSSGSMGADRSSGGGSGGGVGGLALVRQLLHLSNAQPAPAPQPQQVPVPFAAPAPALQVPIPVPVPVPVPVRPAAAWGPEAANLAGARIVPAAGRVMAPIGAAAAAAAAPSAQVPPRQLPIPIPIPVPVPVPAPPPVPVPVPVPGPTPAPAPPLTHAAAAAPLAAGGTANIDDAKACIVCYDAPRKYGFLHGETLHTGVCGECAELLRRRKNSLCPTCRQPVEAMVEFFD